MALKKRKLREKLVTFLLDYFSRAHMPGKGSAGWAGMAQGGCIELRTYWRQCSETGSSSCCGGRAAGTCSVLAGS